MGDTQYNPTWSTPLARQIAAWKEEQTPDANAGITVSEWPQTGCIVVRGRANDLGFCQAAETALNVSWPTMPRSTAENASLRVLWLSPDEWAVICPYTQKAHYLNTLLETFVGLSAQVVDNSGGMTGLVLSGGDVQTLLRHLTPYDIGRLDIGECVGTVFSQAHVLLHRAHAAQYEVVIRRSFADYVWRLLLKAARPYGLKITA